MEISDILQMDQGYAGQNRNISPRLKKRAQSLCWRYNQSPPGAEGERRIILEQLLGTCHPLTFIEPWFRCDYGFNIPDRFCGCSLPPISMLESFSSIPDGPCPLGNGVLY